MSTARPAGRRPVLLGGAAVLVLAAASTLTVAAATGAFDGHRGATTATCRAPALSGAVVSVRLTDMRAMMRRAPMTGGTGPLMSQHDWRLFRAGMMRVLAAPTAVPHGIVSLRVTNAGYLTHELVVLPLPAGRQPGERAPGPDGSVSEAGSRGEASATCAAGAGDGIAPGGTGWVSLQLPAGRYELVCNLPGHYAAGMYAVLEVG